MSKKELLTPVLKELDHIKTNATKKELDKLSFSEYNTTRTNFFSSTDVFLQELTFTSKIEYTPLEQLIMLNPTKPIHEDIINYLKGNSSKIDLLTCIR
jgi:hypothetical protein